MISKTLQNAKTILVSILRIDFISSRLHVVLSTRKCLYADVVYRTRTLLIRILYLDLKLFILFVLMKNSFVSKDVAVEVAVVDRKGPFTQAIFAVIFLLLMHAIKWIDLRMY